MRKIEKSYNLADKKEAYNILNVQTQKLSEHAGERFKVNKWALIEDTNSNGEVVNSFVFMDDDGVYYGTNSRAFIDGLVTYLEIFDDGGLTELEVGTKKSKNGRNYIYFVA